MLQLQKAVVRAGQADGDRAGADRIRVVGTLPGGACRRASPPLPAQPPTHSLREKPQPGSLSFAHSEPLPPQDSRPCLSLFLGPVVPKGIGDLDPQGAPGALSVLSFAGWSRRKKYTWGLLGPHPCGHPRAAWRAHLDSLYDNGEGVVLAVLGQQVLADPTEGEVPVVKALEVGLSCDKTLSWGDRGEGRVGVPMGPLGDRGKGRGSVPAGLLGRQGEGRVGIPAGPLGGQGGGESGCPRGFPGETRGKRERVSQWVPWGVSQQGALPGFLHTRV